LWEKVEWDMIVLEVGAKRCGGGGDVNIFKVDEGLGK
jgi:hypothetical protein